MANAKRHVFSGNRKRERDIEQKTETNKGRRKILNNNFRSEVGKLNSVDGIALAVANELSLIHEHTFYKSKNLILATKRVYPNDFQSKRIVDYNTNKCILLSLFMGWI